jgi:hypothetical protein
MKSCLHDFWGWLRKRRILKINQIAHAWFYRTSQDMLPRVAFRRSVVETAKVEADADTTTIGVCANLPDVYRMKDILMLVIKSPFQY